MKRVMVFAVLLLAGLPSITSAEGDDLGARFFGPFRWPAKLKKGRNVLEVTVTNLLVNQVGDDAVRDRVLRTFQPNGNYDRFQRPFDKKNHESGLFGPVTVQ